MHFLVPNLNTLYYKICVGIQRAFLNSLVPVKGPFGGLVFCIYSVRLLRHLAIYDVIAEEDAERALSSKPTKARGPRKYTRIF